MIDEYLVNTIYLLGSRLNRWRMDGTFRLFRNRSYLGQVLHTLEKIFLCRMERFLMVSQKRWKWEVGKKRRGKIHVGKADA